MSCRELTYFELQPLDVICMAEVIHLGIVSLRFQFHAAKFGELMNWCCLQYLSK